MYYSARGALTGERDLAYAQVIIHRYLRVAPRPVPTWSIRASGTIDGGASPVSHALGCNDKIKKTETFPGFPTVSKMSTPNCFPMKSHTSVHRNQIIQKFKLQKQEYCFPLIRLFQYQWPLVLKKVMHLLQFIYQYHDTTFI